MYKEKYFKEKKIDTDITLVTKKIFINEIKYRKQKRIKK
jgi:hypothetical protein